MPPGTLHQCPNCLHLPSRPGAPGGSSPHPHSPKAVYTPPLTVCGWLPAPTPIPTPRAEKETKAKVEKIIEIRELTTQIMNIKR